MTEMAQRQELEPAVPLAALFTAFLAVCLYGVGGGGGIVWARRIAVEKRRWISDREFADIVSLCQLMPGPNIVGIAVCVGAKMRGTIGTIAAVSGFLVIPWAIGFSVGLLFLEYAHLPVLRNVLGGIAATAAGLLIATGLTAFGKEHFEIPGRAGATTEPQKPADPRRAIGAKRVRERRRFVRKRRQRMPKYCLDPCI